MKTIVWPLVMCVLLGGCTALHSIQALTGGYGTADCAGALLSTPLIPNDLRIHDRVRYRVGDREIGLELVTETRAGGLTVIALTSFGNKAFTIRQRGDDVEIVSHMGRALPVAPYNVLRDLVRVHFLSSVFDAEKRGQGVSQEAAQEAAQEIVPARKRMIGAFVVIDETLPSDESAAREVRERVLRIQGPQVSGEGATIRGLLGMAGRRKDVARVTVQGATREIVRAGCGYSARFVTVASGRLSP